MLATYGFMHYQTIHIDDELIVLQQKSNQLNSQVKQLNAELAQHKPSPEKVAAVERLKREIQAKKTPYWQ